jgi:hypothetical protein
MKVKDNVYIPNHFQRKLRRLQWTDEKFNVEIIPRIPLDILLAEKNLGYTNEEKAIKNFYTVEIMRPLLNYFNLNEIEYEDKGRSLITRIAVNQIYFLSLYDFVAGIVERREGRCPESHKNVY